MDKTKPNPQRVTRFIRAFEDASGIAVTSSAYPRSQGKNGRSEPDLHLRVPTEGGEIDIVAMVRREGYPRDIRDAVWRLEEFQRLHTDGKSMIPMVIAEHLSPGARELLRSRNIGYFDASESLFLKYRQWLINIDRPDQPARLRRAASLFTGAREQVIHALLWSTVQTQAKWLNGLELAQLAETSTYTVSLTLQELQRMEWVESEGSGRNLRRRLTEPGKLLDAWADSWRTRTEAKSRWYVYPPKPQILLSHLSEKIHEHGLDDWAYTGESAANAMAPLLTGTDTAEIVVPPGRADLYAELMGLQSAEKGSNVTLVERRGASLILQQSRAEDSSRFVSPFILYLDLQDGRGRRKELASHLRSTILKI